MTFIEIPFVNDHTEVPVSLRNAFNTATEYLCPILFCAREDEKNVLLRRGTRNRSEASSAAGHSYKGYHAGGLDSRLHHKNSDVAELQRAKVLRELQRIPLRVLGGISSNGMSDGDRHGA